MIKRKGIRGGCYIMKKMGFLFAFLSIGTYALARSGKNNRGYVALPPRKKVS